MLYANITWAQTKALKTAGPTLKLYYTQVGVSPNEYHVIVGNSSQGICDVVVAADVTDFETNYKPSAISVATPNDALSTLDTGLLPTFGKTNVLKTGTLVTTAVTVDQVILTYTVTAGKTFFVEYVTFEGTTTAFSNNVILGTISLETPSGTKVISARFNANASFDRVIPFTEAIPISAGVVIRVVTTPAVTNSITWIANFGGYEI
jgi:hypothetical protein